MQAVVVIPTNDASVTACHGSPKTQNIQDAVTHAQSSKPMACRATEQVPPVRKQRPVAHRLPIMRLLSRATGVDARRKISHSRASHSEAATIFALHLATKIRKVLH